MTTQRRRQLLAATFVAQAVVLLVIVALHGARMADGTRVELAVRPIDPTDLVRGDYVDLGYDELDGVSLDDSDGFDVGDDVYVGLRAPERSGEAWQVDGFERDPNDLDLRDGDAFMRLGVDSDLGIDTTSISTYYEDSADARRLERDLFDGGIAEIVLDRDGDPMLDRVRG